MKTQRLVTAFLGLSLLIVPSVIRPKFAIANHNPCHVQTSIDIDAALNLSFNCIQAGHLQSAEAVLQDVLAFARQRRLAMHEAWALLGLGDIETKRENFGQARPYYEAAIPIFSGSLNQVSATLGLANTYENLGDLHEIFDEYPIALNYHQQSLRLWRQLDRSHKVGHSLSSIAWSFNRIGRYDQALVSIEDALQVFRLDDNLWGIARALDIKASIYDNLGNYKAALENYQASLDVKQQSCQQSNQCDHHGQAVTLNNMGFVFNNLDRSAEARDSLQSARLICETNATCPTEFKAKILSNLAAAFFGLEDYTQALEYTQASIELKPITGDRLGLARSYRQLGIIQRQLGEYETAFTHFTQSLAILAELQQQDPEKALTLSHIGYLSIEIEQHGRAIVFLKEAVNLYEGLRSNLQGLEQSDQVSYADSISKTYRTLADVLIEQGRIPEAQQVLDLLKLEELREFTRATWVEGKIVYTEAEDAVKRDYGSLIELGQEIYTCRKNRCSELARLRERQRTLTDDFEAQIAEFEASIAENDKNDPIFQNPENLSDEAYELLQANPDAILIYPFVTKDKLWLLWASLGGSVGSTSVDVSRAELSKTVQLLGKQLNSPGSLEQLQALSKDLYEWLIQPIETSELTKNSEIRQLIFVNDRVTRYVPMAVLFDGQRYLLEKYTLSTVIAPAITDTETTLTDLGEPQVLALGLTEGSSNFSALPAVQYELDAIVRSDEEDKTGVYPGDVLLNDRFTLGAVQDNVEFRQILHIATHAKFVAGRLRDSFLVLGDGTHMGIQDIESMQESLRDLHLVVLSACQTALGGPLGGNTEDAVDEGLEIAGLSSYFLTANRAETVIASLWKVSDATTSILMQRFYENLATGDFSKAEALQRAQLSLLGSDRTVADVTRIIGQRPDENQASSLVSHPYYWAPFILIGNGL